MVVEWREVKGRREEVIREGKMIWRWKKKIH